MRRRTWVITTLILAALTACSLPADQSMTADMPAAEPVADIATLGYEPVFTYDYSEQRPAIITDRIGYTPTGKKVIYIEGTDPARDYKIIDNATEEVVYEGKLHRITEADEKDTATPEKSIYIGDFTELTGEGTYRAFQEDVGYSYEFSIGRDNYHALYNEAYKTITEAEYIQTSALIYTLSNLMLTHEIYANAPAEDSFIRGGIEELLSQQHPRTGAVYQDLQNTETLSLIEEELSHPSTATIQTDSMISLSSTAELAGVLAQYYVNYFETDQALAVQSLRAAGKAYNYIDRFREGVKSDSYYFAASELYRATGQYRYRKAIADYDLIPEQSRTVSDYDYTMLADVAYLSSEYKTDYVRCEELMSRYRDRASAISGSSSKQTFYVQADIERISEDELLHNMMTLGLVSYILSGREYASVQSNYLHYMFGINKDMINYYTEPYTEGGQPLGKDIIRLSKLIFILGNGE